MKFGTHLFEKFDSTLNKIHYVKSVQIRSIFWSVFSCIPIFLIYGVNLRIQSEYRKIRARKYSVFGHFSRSDCFHFKGVRKRLKKKFLMITWFFLTSAMDSKADGQRNYLPLLSSKWYLVFNFPLPNILKIIQIYSPLFWKSNLLQVEHYFGHCRDVYRTQPNI